MEGSFLRSMGFDLESLRGMDLDEVDALLQSRLSDPKSKGLVEEFYWNHPQLRAAGVASLEASERNSSKLLESEDSRSLLLSHEEVFLPMLLVAEIGNR